MAAGFKQVKYGGDGGKARRESEAGCAGFEIGDAALEGGAGGIWLRA